MSAGDWKDLYKASSEGDLELVQFHLRQGVDPNYQHPEILSLPLVAALLNGHESVARCLFEAGAKPDVDSIFDNMNAFEAARRMGGVSWLKESEPPPRAQTRDVGMLAGVWRKLTKSRRSR